MHRLRLALLLALPAMLALSACGGNGSSVIGTGISAQDAQVRFLNGAPDVASFDYRFWPSSGTRPSSPAGTSFAYGAITSFAAFSVGTYDFEVDQDGTSTTIIPVCSIPTLNGGTNYTIVVAGTGGTHTCLVFNDENYTNTGAVRLHHASPALNAAGTSTIVWGGAAGLAPSSTLISAATFSNTAQVQPVVPVGDVTGTPVTYSVGASPGGANPAAGATFSPTYALASTSLIQGGTSASQPDTSGVIPYANFPGVSLFAIDCSGTAPTGASACIAGATVLGVFDNK